MADEQDWSEIEVFADRLQARGDPRGELLALEMASERSTSSAEARRLNREAQQVRDAHHELVWPAAVAHTRFGLRAGFVVSADHDEIGNSSIPLELLLSLRSLSVGQPLENCVPLLEAACRRGLRLEGLGHWLERADAPFSLDCLRRFVEHDAQAPALEWISFASPVSDLAVLTGLAKLVSCSFRVPMPEAELRSLAPLRLERLTLHGQGVARDLAAWFGDTLTQLRLRDCEGSLASLAGLSRLTTLSLEGERMADAVGDLHGLLQLEELALPRLDDDGLSVLAGLNLRELTIGTMPAQLVHRLPLLRSLEALAIHRIEDGRLDVSPLAELPNLRRLVAPGDLLGTLTLPPKFERLVISGSVGPVPIRGEVASLCVFDCDLRSVPASVLESVRELWFVWFDEQHDQGLTELPRLVPRLERLSLANYVDQWTWSEAPEILGALPRLRALEMDSGSVHELAERARTFPELCVIDSDWPRSCGLVR